MRILFMGTPDFSVPSLEALVKSSHKIIGAVTQPDRPKGRGHKLCPSPVKEFAQNQGLPVLQPVRVREPEFVEKVRELGPEAIVVVAFGQIIPKTLLELPPYGCINVHASLLPKYRGASPIQAAIAAGEKVTGVTTMYMNEGLDTGDIILQRTVPIFPSDNAGTMHDKLANSGAELLLETLSLIEQGKALRTPQNDAEATYAPKLEKASGAIDWGRTSEEIFNLVRAMNPWPGAFTYFGGKLVKILEVRMFDGHLQSDVLPGTVIDTSGEYALVKAGFGAVYLGKIQLSGKRPISGRDIINGLHLSTGDRFLSHGGTHND